MISRPARVYFPCLYLSHIKFRSHSFKANGNQGEKVFLQSPFIWSPHLTYLCENQAENIVKKLDIDAIIKSKAKENFKYNVYPNIKKGSAVLWKESMDHIQQNNHIPIQGIHQILSHKLKSCDAPINVVNIHENSKENVMSKNLRENHSLCKNLLNDISDERHPDKGKSDNLPSKEQLDEMMIYFMDQATNLFTSTGWSYQKCSYNIVFENIMLGTKTKSLNAYVMQINMMKNIARFILSNPELNILRMTKCISDGSIHVRWQVEGVPRYLKPFSMLRLVDDKRFIRYIDGYSIFYMYSDGLYHQHVLTKMTPLKSDIKNSLTTQFFSQIGFHRRPGLDGDLPKQPVFPAFQDGVK